MQAERERGSVDAELAELCAQLAPEPLSEVGRDAKLRDLGFDSLACAELALAVEERFGVRLADSDVGAPRTVADVADAVRAKLPSRPRIAPDLGAWQPFGVRVAGPALRWYLRMEVSGREHVPPEGPVILAANHRSFWDVPAHVLAAPRTVVFMAKQELFKGPVMPFVWRKLGGFPVRRELADVRAVDTAVALLEEGRAVGIYPEGTRSRTGEMLPFLNGAAWLALKTGAPIVPCGLKGSGRHERPKRPWQRRHVLAAFGPPIRVEAERNPKARRERMAAVTAELLAEITRLVS